MRSRPDFRVTFNPTFTVVGAAEFIAERDAREAALWAEARENNRKRSARRR
jgi:hypothetical protein